MVVCREALGGTLLLLHMLKQEFGGKHGQWRLCDENGCERGGGVDGEN